MDCPCKNMPGSHSDLDWIVYEMQLYNDMTSEMALMWYVFFFLPQRITACLVNAAFFGALGSSYLYGYNLSVVNAPAPVRFIVSTRMYSCS